MKFSEPGVPLNILLAEDDIDDYIFFKGALGKSTFATNLVAVHDGKKLMELLVSGNMELPDALFLDLNMPRKNGFECLSEIKLNEKLKQMPVIMFSTSNDEDVVSRLYENGAQYFIRKPPLISQFEKIVHRILTLIARKDFMQRGRADFVIELEVPLEEDIF